MNIIKYFYHKFLHNCDDCEEHDDNGIFDDIDYNKELINYGIDFTTKNNLLIMCILSSVVYKENHKKLLNDIGVKKYTIDRITDVTYGLFNFGNGDIILSFKGTSTLSDVLSDIDFIKIDDEYNIPGKMHKGFHDMILKSKVCEKIKDILDKMYIKTLYIVGHSLGGALATIFYSYLKMYYPNRMIQLITYGCPRVGDSDFCKAITNYYRIINGSDIVTKIPLPLVFGYRHPKNKTYTGNTKLWWSIKDHHLKNYYINLKKLDYCNADINVLIK